MLKPRVIPALLLRNAGLVKTIKFKDPRYVGDPINAVRIFNDKEVDELVFLDITASLENRGPNFELLTRIASEAFMPFGYGGGITSLDQIKRLFTLGVEKVVLNSVAIENPQFVTDAMKIAGSSSIVVSIDVRKNVLGNHKVWCKCGTKKTGSDPVELAKEMEARGAGEILIQSIDQDGTLAGYDLGIVEKIANSVDIPVIGLGGAAALSDFKAIIEVGASAAAAGSMFVFHGKHRAVLIKYPEYDVLDRLFTDELPSS